MPERLNDWLSVWAIGLGGLLVLAMGAWTISKEIAPNLSVGSTPLERIVNTPGALPEAGLTIHSQRTNLSDCEQALRSYQSLETQYLSAEQIAQVEPYCRRMAESVLAATPINSLAWLILTSAAAYENDASAFARNYANSAATSPYESWLASMRVQLVNLHPELVNSDLLGLVDQDLAAMAASSSFVTDLAQLYLVNPMLRERITVALETLPENRQAVVLSLIRQALSESGR